MTVWNSADKDSQVDLTNSNLTATMTQSGSGEEGWVRGDTSRSSGKKYFEVAYTQSGTSVARIGIADSDFTVSAAYGFGFGDDCCVFDSTGTFVGGESTNESPNGDFATGQTIGVAVDIPNRKMFVSVNGSWIDYDPASDPGFDWPADVGSTVFPLAGFAAISAASAASFVANFGATAFTYSVPSGYEGWDAAAAGQPFRKRWGGVRFSGLAHRQHGVKRWRAPPRRGHDLLISPERKLILGAKLRGA